MIWVPAHELEKKIDEAEAIMKFIRYEKTGGWYGFCGRASHIPRGLSIRYGQEKSGGKIVEAVLDTDKKTGLETFRLWEVGAIEDGFETTWESKRYTLSCSLAPAMALIANMYSTGRESCTFLENLHSSAFITFASKKSVFYGEEYKEFTRAVGDTPSKEILFQYTCSRCSVIPCLNRQAPFYSNKILQNLVKAPESPIK